MPSPSPHRHGRHGSGSAELGELQGELRQLTVLFCDLVASTELTMRLDLEEYGELTATYQEIVGAMAERYGGDIVRYLGDGVLIEFGWPVAHEDDGERAVRAGLDIATAIEELDRRLPSDIPLAVRIGVHTGPVLVGEFGASSRRETLALGRTMNLAARVQEAAPPNTVVITDETLRVTRGFFVTEPLEARTFKGFPGVTRVHRVVQPSGIGSPLQAPSAMLTPFVGRARELDSLLKVWRDGKGGQRAAVLITGEAGVGKSRLVHEFRQLVRDQPHSWLECRCSSYTQRSALLPITELLQRGLDLRREDTPGVRLTRLERALDRSGIVDSEAVSLLGRLLGVLSDETPLVGPEYQRRRTHELIVEWLEHLAQRQPLILLVEDLHWADTSTAEVLQRLLALSDGSNIMLIATARPELDTMWSQSPAVETVELQPLSSSEVQHLLEGLVTGAELPAPVVDRVVSDAAGLPLYAEEIGRTLLESDLLIERDGRLELTEEIDRLDIPITLQDSIMARLDRGISAKQVAQCCAVVGRQFDQELIEAVAALSREEVADGFRELVEDGLIVAVGERPRPTFRFRHLLIQEAGRRSMLRRARQRIHAKAAVEISRRLASGDLDIAIEVIARHHEEAGETGLAIERYAEAARQSADRSGYVEAAEHLNRAVRLLDELQEMDEPSRLGRRCELLIEIGHSRWNGGDFEGAQEAFAEGAGIASHLRLPQQMADAALGYGGRMAFGAGFLDARLIELLEAALEALPDDDDARRARIMGRLAEALTFSESIERRSSLCEEAVRIARGLNNPEVLASVLQNEHWALSSPDNLEERLVIASEIVACAKRARSPLMETEGQMWLAADLIEAGDVDAFEREFANWTRVAEKVQQRYQLWAVAVTRAMRLLLQGNLVDGERQAIEAFEIGHRDQNQNALQLFGVQLAFIRREQGRSMELEAPLRENAERYQAIPTWRCALASLYAENDRPADARAQLEPLAVDRFAGLPRDSFWLGTMTLLGDTVTLLGDAENAALLYEQFEPYAGRCVMLSPFTTCWGSASRTLGALAMTVGMHEDARQHFEEALVQNSELGARVALTRTQLQYAATLSSLDGEGDRARAHQLLQLALATATELSLVVRERQALELLDSLK